MAGKAKDGILVHNFVQEAGLKYNFPKKVLLWEETLRDGEQTPGVYFTPEEKLELAKRFDDLGVPIADCGIPAVSEKEKQAVKMIANEGLRNLSVLGACRTLKSDIDACLECDVDEISPFIAASPVHLKHKLKMTEDEVVEKSVESVEYGKAHGVKVTFVTEDTVRSDFDFVERLYKAVVEAGADRLLLCDTVGVMTPRVFQWWIQEFRRRVKPKVELGVHIHNDFGMATANSLAAVEEGVAVVNTCFGGLGERAGNAPFEEVVLALELLYGIKTGIKLDKIYETAQRVEELSGVPLGITKPIVGYNAFTHESGIHTDGVIKNTLTYEPIQVEMLNRQRRFVFGKHTGTRAVEARLADHRMTATKEQLLQIANEIKVYTEKKTKNEVADFIRYYRAWDLEHKGVTPKEFWSIVKKAGLKVPAGAEKELAATAR
ncbi:MAG: homoaconitate hydratase [Euryarchaeota archaeon]|nr:homoaconitate hydratase [Euryarchaeota archaeon]